MKKNIQSEINYLIQFIETFFICFDLSICFCCLGFFRNYRILFWRRHISQISLLFTLTKSVKYFPIFSWTNIYNVITLSELFYFSSLFFKNHQTLARLTHKFYFELLNGRYFFTTSPMLHLIIYNIVVECMKRAQRKKVVINLSKLNFSICVAFYTTRNVSYSCNIQK